jgi:hypothetical protein
MALGAGGEERRVAPSVPTTPTHSDSTPSDRISSRSRTLVAVVADIANSALLRPSEVVFGDRYHRGVSSPAFVNVACIHAALTEVARRIDRLVRSIDDPAAPAIGHWSTVDVAVHLAHVWENLPALADSNLDSPLTSDASSPWLVQGIAVPRVTLACHILSESLVHGYDIAKALRVRWTIEPAHAALALMGFAFPLLVRPDLHALVDQDSARGFDACYEVRVRGAGRVSQWPVIVTGRLFAWGRRPWLAPRLRQVLRNP